MFICLRALVLRCNRYTESHTHRKKTSSLITDEAYLIRRAELLREPPDNGANMPFVRLDRESRQDRLKKITKNEF
ncbi:MAG TPA: hypothetical protein PKD11_12880 [Pyrinomonadaceae bacterium]|nr:hypothetical protein [Pyrinomonadaceae bacterium]